MPDGGHHGTDLFSVRDKPPELGDLVDHECTDQSQRSQTKKCIEQERVYHEDCSFEQTRAIDDQRMLTATMPFKVPTKMLL